MNKSLQNDIRQLPAAEQLEIAEFIYNSLATSKQLLTDEQLAETRRRSEQVRKEPESTLSSDEMWSEIENLKNARKN
ncbi:addiction module protein [Mariniblastus sp.]|nr:addiction module protein [Mariniblastus sp.]